MDNLIIEVGKYYKTRCGYKVIIYAIYPEKEWYRNIHGAYFKRDCWVSESWVAKGKFLELEEHDLDIVSEWIEPHPAESWEVDKLILVSNDEYVWYKRHFAKFVNGTIFAWAYGQTSWSGSFNELTEYKYAKPAEEE